DAEYIHDTQVLSLAQGAGALVVNDPQGLRDYNEKLAALLFPQCCPATVVSRDPAILKAFVAEQGRAVLKPLDGMGGRSIFLLEHGEANTNVVLETLTGGGRSLAMAQQYLPDISDGDNRTCLTKARPATTCLPRTPQAAGSAATRPAAAAARARPRPARARWTATR